ncbi:MAG: enoyl-CoA hydratase family protein [Candidatus Eremiobacteraeota bacterium]|nr:enoyl-CoA hydratase family protein [Candidatus Eremiobacteraeota bacterium]
MRRDRRLSSRTVEHLLWSVENGVGYVTLNRPQRKNALTFDSYAELRDLFRDLRYAADVHAVVLAGAGDDFCSGGDVHEIIGPLTRMSAPELLAFTRMTGDVIRAMLAAPQPIIAAIDGACAGAGAMLALASDVRIGTERCAFAFLFVRVGLSGADMGACTLLPRVVGHGRAAELLLTGRALPANEALEWGLLSRVCVPEELRIEASSLASDLAQGPTFAHAMTKTMLRQEWAMDVDSAIEAEGQAQALCMQTRDFHRAFEAFSAKEKPRFEGG